MLAKQISTWSKDPSTKVGAVLVNDNKQIISTGYNGFARGLDDSEERLNDRELKYKLVIHAEENALLYATQPVQGCTAYIYPFPPCTNCASKLIQSGIKRIVCTDYMPERWIPHFDLSFQILKEAGINVLLIPLEDN